MARKESWRRSPEQIIRKLRDADVELAAGRTVGKVLSKLEVARLSGDLP